MNDHGFKACSRFHLGRGNLGLILFKLKPEEPGPLYKRLGVDYETNAGNDPIAIVVNVSIQVDNSLMCKRELISKWNIKRRDLGQESFRNEFKNKISEAITRTSEIQETDLDEFFKNTKVQ